MYDEAPQEQEGPTRLQSRRRGVKEDRDVSAFVQMLEQEAAQRVSGRVQIEERWLEDLRMYLGEYDDGIKREFAKDDGRSQLFFNLIGPKTDAMSARLYDLIFPTDDRSWGIQPTPVPEMERGREKATADRKTAIQTQEQVDKRLEMETLSPEQQQQLRQMGQEAEQAQSIAEGAISELHNLRDEARKRSSLMQDEIDDQLKASNYQAKCRDVIDDACKLGTGVMKGPVLTEKTRKKWKAGADGVHQLAEVADMRPGFERVDPWGFFPDPNARNIEECEDFYERHLFNKKQMRQLSRRPDMDQDAIRRILETDPADGQPNSMSQLFSLTGDETHQIRDKYQVWEFTGPIDMQHFATLVDVYQDADALEIAEEVDSLAELHVKVWFCQGEVLKFAMHPMESGESIYSVFNIKKSEASLFGYGIPRIGRDPQQSINAAERLMHDNAKFAAGPQIVINRNRIKPENNSSNYSLKPFRVWQAVDGAVDSAAFEVYQFDMNQPLLQAIIEMGRRDLDEMTAMPQIAQGEQGAGVTKTAQGMALLMNSANVTFRRVVKNWDDDMAVPNIRRMYDFNMQHSEKAEIKGDYEVDARGSSVLLVREMQSTNLMNYATMFADHPRWGQWIKEDGLMREIAKVSMIPAEAILKTKDEVEKDQQAAGEQQDPMAMAEMAKIELQREELDYKREELEAKVAMNEREAASREKAAEYSYRAAMERTVAQLNDHDEERDVKLTMKDKELGQKDRSLAAEAHFKAKTGDGAGGAI